MSILIHNALIVDGEREPRRGWLLTDGELIAALGDGDVPADIIDRAGETVDARGAMLMPGTIDCHVHFREPGMTHKADIAGESRAAVAGGVTSYIDMPNTRPATVTIADWQAKMSRAAEVSAANYAFMVGATADNLAELQKLDLTAVPAVKVFMGSSTGNMLLDSERELSAVFADQPARVVVHAEAQDIIDANTAAARPIDDPGDMMWHTRLRDNRACVAATECAMTLAARYGTRLHVAHVTTRDECSLFDPADTPVGKQITAEVSPHHLLNCSDDYARLGSRIKMNPAVKSAADRDALRSALRDGRLDIVATDHAPHLLSEKAGDVFTAVSGAPLVQFSLPVMLDLYDDPTLVVRRMAIGPADLFGIDRRGRLRPGHYADLVIVERLDTPHIITDADVISRCGWTPLIGRPLTHRIVRTIINGDGNARPLSFV